jgi:hypothetical protein
MLLHQLMALVGTGACPGNKLPSPPAYFGNPQSMGPNGARLMQILCPSYFHYHTQLPNKCIILKTHNFTIFLFYFFLLPLPRKHHNAVTLFARKLSEVVTIPKIYLYM